MRRTSISAGCVLRACLQQMRKRSMAALVVVVSVTSLSSVAIGNPGLATRPLNDCVAPERPAVDANVDVEIVATQNGAWPVEMLRAPGDPTRWYVADRSGYVAIYQDGPTLTRTGTLLDISGQVERVLGGREWNEMGLLGMAFHPDFASNGEFFLYYSADGTGGMPLEARLSRFTSLDGGATANPNSEEVILRVPRDKQWHWGGRPTFGNDGYLYMSLGDGGTHHNAQNLNNINGKFLRIDVDGGAPYAIPNDNPFAAGGGRPEIFAWGFRNPWRWSFDSLTGEIWEGDVGPSDREEVNKIVKGGNYGWSLFQGTLCQFSTTCNYTGLVLPVLEYSHDSSQEISGDAVIGGFVYRGSNMPGFYGKYVFGDTNGKLFSFDPATNGPTELIATSNRFILSFAESSFDRELYALSPGAILRLVQSAGSEPNNFPTMLSSSACVQGGNATEPATGLIPYSVNVELWSDGATKRRWMGVPNDAEVHINSDGDFGFPAGTVLVKEFSLSGLPIETRWMVRHADGQWAGYTFEWNAGGTDASLVPPEGLQKQIGGVLWTYPSRSQCLSCHTEAAGRSLGPEIAQLNSDIFYPQSGLTGNQLETLEFIGMLDGPLPEAPANLDRLPLIDEAGTGLEERARAYLHANCAMCHRPNGPGQGGEDFRYWLPTSQIGAINEEPTQGDLGIAGARLITPGTPGTSILLQRMLTLNPTHRMPPLATSIVDTAGTQLVANWIASMPQSDIVEILAATWNNAAQTLLVEASSDLGDSVSLSAFTKSNGVLTLLGPLAWQSLAGRHVASFAGVSVEPACVAVSSIGGGYDEIAVAGSCSAGGGGDPEEIPLTAWLPGAGGVSAVSNRVSYNGAGGQWNANSITSANFSTLGISQPFEVQFTIDTEPAGTTWIVGLGVTEGSLNWRDVDFGLRSSDGSLRIYENGVYVNFGPDLAVGDVLSLYVNAGVIEYRLNGLTVHTSSYSGMPAFYVDSSFRSGAVSISVSVFAVTGDPPDPDTIPISTWFGATAGVTDTDNDLQYAGTPQNWISTINSAPLSLLGATNDYSASWTIGSNPAGTTWVAGFGVSETDSGWRDVEYGLRSSNGLLTVYVNGSYAAGGGPLSAGDELSIAVSGTLLEFRVNGVPIHSRTISGSEDFYIDSSFKSGAIVLENFVLRDF